MKRSANELSSIVRLLDEALDLPESEQLSWVDALPDETYGGLKTTLREMLQAGQRAGVMTQLERRIANVRLEALSGDESAELTSGSRVGPYELERQLGEGGMGTVWLARRADGAYQRQVALKLPHVTWTGDLAARLARERDILASLQHENIAGFLDAGLDGAGRPFLALEYIEGIPIDAYCRAEALSVRARIELVVDVAKAVAHAHSRLIVHRDLKPGNILVTRDGAVRLLDFGVAMLLETEGADRPRLTQVGSRALTVDYASPEQIRGDSVGTASDVYSLGVVTFELLTGTRPYRLQRGTIAELEQAIADAEPRAASDSTDDPEIRRALRGDLDAVLGKAMKKDPAQRYPTVAAFGEELSRYLSGMPVQAQPDRALYRARKFVARNSVQVGAATLVLLAIVVGSGVALWQAHAAQEQASVARTQAIRAERVKDFILSIFDAADSADHKTTALELLQSAHQRVLTELKDQPRDEVELLNSVGYSMLGLDDLKEAYQPLEEAVRIGRERLGATDPTTLRASASLGEALAVLDKSDEAVEVLEPTVAALRLQNDPATLLDALQWLSDVRDLQGKVDAAADLAVESLQVAQSHADLISKRQLYDAYYTIAGALRSALRPGAVDAARKAYELAQQIWESPTARSVLNSRSLYNNLLLDEGDLQLAKRELAEVVAQFRQTVGDIPTNDLALALLALGRAQAATGDKAAAMTSFESSFKILADVSGNRLTRAAGIIDFHMGNTLLDTHEYKAAEQHLRDANLELSAATGAENPESRSARAMHAVALARLGRFSEADAELVSVQTNAPQSPRVVAMMQWRLGAVRALEKRYPEAQVSLEDAVKFLSTDIRPNASKIALASASASLAEVLSVQHQDADAKRALDRAIDIWRGLQPEGSPELSDALRLRSNVRFGGASAQ